MSQLTRCPNCATTFRVSDAQLALRGGRVRCGHCSFVFDARACQVDADPVTIIDLGAGQLHDDDDLFASAPPGPAEAPPAPPAPEPEPAPADAAAAPASLDEHEHWAGQLEELPPPVWLKQASAPDDEHSLPPPPPPSLEEEVQEPSVSAPPEESFVPPSRLREDRRPPVAETPSSHDWLRPPGPSPWRWLWRGLNLLALASAIALSALLLRQPLIEHYPPARPWLAQACQQIGCELHAPSNAEYLLLDGIEFSFDPDDHERLELSGVLRNMAPFDQAWPMIDVQLLDLKGQRVARRLLPPAVYLPAAERSQPEFAAQQEVHLQVELRLRGLAVENYKVEVFYPGR